MCEIVEIPMAALEAIETVYAFQVAETEDDLVMMLENIIHRFNIPVDDPYELWSAYLDWQVLQNKRVQIH